MWQGIEEELEGNQPCHARACAIQCKMHKQVSTVNILTGAQHACQRTITMKTSASSRSVMISRGVDHITDQPRSRLYMSAVTCSINEKATGQARQVVPKQAC